MVQSTITNTEDVSYVCSPYLPQCVRGFGPDTTDNSPRSHESAAGASGIKDELDENIILRHLNVIVGEWCVRTETPATLSVLRESFPSDRGLVRFWHDSRIPFGANQIVSLNEKLGSSDRCQVRRNAPLFTRRRRRRRRRRWPSPCVFPPC